jgi:chromatin modification-related protein VID21
MGQTSGFPNSNPRLGSGLASGGLAGHSTSNLANVPQGAVGGLSHQPRPQAGLQGMPNVIPSNGALPVNMMGPKGPPHALVTGGQGAGRGMGNSPEHMRVLYEANRLQQQQQLMLAARQQHQQHQRNQNGSNVTANQPHSSPNLGHSGIAGPSGSANSPAFRASMVANNRVPSPSMLGTHGNGTGNAGSPRQGNGQNLSSGVMPAISQLAASIQRQNPEMSPEEIQRIAATQLTSYRQHAAQNVTQKSMNQAALNAAAGAANAGAHAANASAYNRQQGMMTNEQVQAYNAQLRQQQAAQRAGAGYGSGGLNSGLAMNTNGGMGGMVAMTGFTGSPGLTMSRPVSNHAGQGPPSRSATPRDSRGSNGGLMAQGSPR